MLEYIVDPSNRDDDYGSVKKYEPISGVKEFIDDYLDAYSSRLKNGYDSNCFLCVKCKLDNAWIPTVDCDSEKKMLVTSAWLEEQGINYVVFSSSRKEEGSQYGANKFWVFADIPMSDCDEMLKFISMVPGQDNKYIDCATTNKCLVVRGLFNSDHCRPELMGDLSDDLHPITEKFVIALQEHYGNGLHDWINRYISYKDMKVDPADPKFGEPVKSFSIVELFKSLVGR